jgi:hypothetical protein
MNIVTSRTDHGRRKLITAAPLQESYLAAMNIDSGVKIGDVAVEIIIERLSGDIRECRSNWESLARMTLRTDFDILVMRKFRRINDGFW